jgi:hypothetical protein
MSTENVISIEIPAGDLQIVRNALTQIQTILAPYLLLLPSSTRQLSIEYVFDQIGVIDKS